MSIDRIRLRKLISAALFAALIVIGARIQLPFIAGIPLTLQTPMIQLAVLILPFPFGLYSVGLYLLLGAAGFPAFTFGGGIGYFLEKTGGYLFGFFIASIPLQVWRSFFIRNFTHLILGLVLHTALIFLCGIWWHAWVDQLSFLTLAKDTMMPLYFVSLVKIFFTAILARELLKSRIQESESRIQNSE